MVQDLRADSANFERSGDTGSPPLVGFGLTPPYTPDISIGRYENSMVHRSRQHWGPTAEPSSASSERMQQQPRGEEPVRYPQPTVAPSYSQPPSEPSYGYGEQYNRNSDPRGDPRVDPRASHPAPSREYNQQYDSRTNPYGTPNSMSSGEYNLAPGHPNYSAGYNSGYAPEAGQRPTDARYMDPRSAQPTQPQYSQPGHGSQPST